MPTPHVEPDAELLAQAAEVLGTKTETDTVNEALRQIVHGAARRSHVDELANGALPDLAKSETIAGAWR